MSLITPHGGKLINRCLEPTAAAAALQEAAALTAVPLSLREQFDLEMIAIGAFSPLQGFLGRTDFEAVCKQMRLADGMVWPIPITLCPPNELAGRIEPGQKIALSDSEGRVLALMHVREKYLHDKNLEIPSVYGTTEDAHPGVAIVRKQGDSCLAGPIDVIVPNHQPEFAEYRLPPAKTRQAFAARSWNTVAAFQTRNPIHRSHEYLTKCALEMTDGLLIHPLVGETKSDDVPAAVRMQCYQTLIEKYYNPQRTMLSVMPLAMRYAGPREAVLHALIRKNYGVTHFIVGRDHAGVGHYYGTYDAQKVFEQFDVPREIGVTILKFEHAAWCKACAAVVSPKTCPHGEDQRIAPSGTKVREMLRSGQRPPAEFTRPEIADILIRWAQSAP